MPSIPTDTTTVQVAPTTPTAPKPCALNVTNPELPAFTTEGEITTTTTTAATAAATEASSSDDEAEDEDAPPASRCAKFWSVWKYLFVAIGFLMLRGISGAVLGPILPGVKREYFGGDKTAAFWTTLLNAISSVIGLVLCPISGYAMDYFGRRPFFLGATLVNLVPPVLLLCFYPNPVPFMIASCLANLVSSSYGAVWIADKFRSDKTRMMAFSFVAGAGSFPTIAGFLCVGVPDIILAVVSVVFSALALLFAYFFIEESLPKEKLRGGMITETITTVNADGTETTTESAPMYQKFDWSLVQNPFSAMKTVLNSKIPIVTVCIMGIVSVSQTGVGEVYFYYLNERVGFNKVDNAFVMLEAGTMWPFVMFAIVPLFKKVLKLHSITLVMISMVCLAGELTLMCLVDAKWQVFALALPAAALVNMSYPALTTVIADGSNGEDQGRRQAGLSAIQDFFGTLAPLFFGMIYSHVDSEWSFLPFAIAATFTIPGMVLSYKLRHWLVVLGHKNRSRPSSAAPTPRASALQYVAVDVDEEALLQGDDSCHRQNYGI